MGLRRAFSYSAIPARAAHRASALLGAQRAALDGLVARGGWLVLEPFVELARPGRKRPELARALLRCREARAALLVADLAELGRDPAFLDAVLAARVRLVAADLPRSGRRTLELLRAVAGRGREAASERSREALGAARRRGVRLGSPRPQQGARAAAAALRAGADARAAQVAPWIAEVRLSNPGASLRAVARALDALGVPAARGGGWSASAVRNAGLRAPATSG